MERTLCPSCGRHHTSFDHKRSIEETGACLVCRAEFVWESEGGYVSPQEGQTTSTEILRRGEKFQVKASGGYDGFLVDEFDTIDEALEFITRLWKNF